MDINRRNILKGLAATPVAAAVVKVLGGGSTPDVRSKVFVLLDGAFALVRHADFYLALAPVVSGHIYKVQHKDVKGTNMFEIVLPKENLIGRESEHIAPEFMNLQVPPADELENPSKIFRVKLPIPTEITCTQQRHIDFKVGTQSVSGIMPVGTTFVYDAVDTVRLFDSVNNNAIEHSTPGDGQVFTISAGLPVKVKDIDNHHAHETMQEMGNLFNQKIELVAIEEMEHDIPGSVDHVNGHGIDVNCKPGAMMVRRLSTGTVI